MIDLKLEEFIFESYTLSFSVPYTDPKVWDLVEDAPVEYDNEVFYIFSIEDEHSEDGQLVRRVESEARWVRLADITRSGDFVITESTVEVGLTRILAETGWTIGQLTEDTATYSIEGTDASVLELLWDWARSTGNEIRFETKPKLIHFIPSIGINRNIGFRYGRNLRSIKRNIIPPRATRFYAYGRDDLSISAHTTDGREYIEDYSWYLAQGLTIDEARENYRKDLTLSDDSFINSTALYAWAQSQSALHSQPQISYSALAADLSRLTGYSGGIYLCGDVVQVEDELLGVSLPARVTRRVVYPSSPERNEVELSFGAVELPNTSATTSRNSQSKSWELFESRNWDGVRRAQSLNTILNRIFLRCTEGSEWVVHYQLQCVAEGDSTVTIEAVDTNHLDEEDNPEILWGTQTVELVDGQEYTFSFSFGQKEIPAGEYELTIRAISDTPGAGILIPVYQTAFWVLARGTTRTQRTFPNSIRFDYTGSIQEFEVPEFVSEIRVQCVAGGSMQPGSGPQHGSGSSGSVTASIRVSPFELFDVYVGEKGAESISAGSGGWPDGGDGGYSTTPQPRNNCGGAGSSQIRRKGAAKIDALIVAPGGGGTGADFDYFGGAAGFYGGEDGGERDWPGDTPYGKGATQFAGGDGGYADYSPYIYDAGEDGDFDGGGNSYFGTSTFSYYGGGGGGGWFGGGGGSGPGSLGIIYGGRGGGGGSGWVGEVFDVEIQDGFMTTDEHGYVIVSWPDPDPSLAEY